MSERKQLSYDVGLGRQTYWVHQRWVMVHARTGTLAQHVNSPTYATKEECQTHCGHLEKNNPPDIVARFFPDGVKPALFWCYESHGQVHSSVDALPAHIQVKKTKKGNYVWSIYKERERFTKMGDGDPDLDALKVEIRDHFPDAVLEML